MEKAVIKNEINNKMPRPFTRDWLSWAAAAVVGFGFTFSYQQIGDVRAENTRLKGKVETIYETIIERDHKVLNDVSEALKENSQVTRTLLEEVRKDKSGTR